MPDAKVSSDELVTLEPTDFIPAIRGTANVRVAGSDFGASPLIAEYIVGSGTDIGTTHYVGGGSAVTSITVSDLDGAADGGYMIITELLQNANSSSEMFVSINNDTTDANYTSRYNYTRSTSGITGSLEPSRRILAYTETGATVAQMTTTVSTAAGNIVAVETSSVEIGRYIKHYTTYHPTSVSNVTSITISAGTANGIGPGTKLSILRRM